jgi:S1-C subfamily serine protease
MPRSIPETAAARSATSTATSPQIAQQLGYDDERGALVAAVEPGSAADEAGLARGDLVLAVDRESIASAGELVQKLRSFGSGDAIALLVRRARSTRCSRCREE